jgi:rhodanese-related sulfurtransferase
MRRLLALIFWCAAPLAWAADDPPAITVEALEARMMSGHAPLVLDVRGSAAYLAGTIPGSIDAGTDPRGFLPDGRPGEAVLIMDPATSAAEAARWFDRLTGYQLSVSILKDGLAAWRARGLPVETPLESFQRPGQTPFTIPRGLCETNTPAKQFE